MIWLFLFNFSLVDCLAIACRLYNKVLNSSTSKNHHKSLFCSGHLRMLGSKRSILHKCNNHPILWIINDYFYSMPHLSGRAHWSCACRSVAITIKLWAPLQKSANAFLWFGHYSLQWLFQNAYLHKKYKKRNRLLLIAIGNRKEGVCLQLHGQLS